MYKGELHPIEQPHKPTHSFFQILRWLRKWHFLQIELISWGTVCCAKLVHLVSTGHGSHIWDEAGYRNTSNPSRNRWCLPVTLVTLVTLVILVALVTLVTLVVWYLRTSNSASLLFTHHKQKENPKIKSGENTACSLMHVLFGFRMFVML